MRQLRDIEVVEDRTEGSRPDVGFLRMRRLVLRNRYADGSTSAEYACDVVSRRHVDAVAAVIWDRDAKGGVRVALRECVRPPAYLRKDKDLPHDDRTHLLLAEIVAGVLEEDDAVVGGIESRAAIECLEEAGYEVPAASVTPLGAAAFPTPGVSDELVHLRAVRTGLDDRQPLAGDGSVMEEAGDVVVLPLREAIRQCRLGEIRDMKTEIALLRLCDAIGYLPQLDCFVDDLSDEHRRRAAGLASLLG